MFGLQTPIFTQVSVESSMIERGLIRRPRRAVHPDIIKPASRASLAIRSGIRCVSLLVTHLVVTLAAISCHPSSSGAARSGAIQVTRATYGGNCGANAGNATRLVASRCDGDLNCNYVIEIRELGDPAARCAKDFEVRYRCSAGAPERRVKADAESGFGSVISLTCE